ENHRGHRRCDRNAHCVLTMEHCTGRVQPCGPAVRARGGAEHCHELCLHPQVHHTATTRPCRGCNRTGAHRDDGVDPATVLYRCVSHRPHHLSDCERRHPRGCGERIFVCVELSGH